MFSNLTFKRALAVVLAAVPFAAFAQYTEHNLVSDGYVTADHVDPNLVNPWGIAESGGSPFWVSENGTGLATVYNTSGTPSSLVVTIPRASGSGTGAPTGQVFNTSSGFLVGGSKPTFLFATEDGTISGWTGGTTAVIGATKTGGSYKGLAIATTGGNTFLYATDFANGTIDKYDSNFNRTTISDPNGNTFNGQTYDPYNVQTLGSHLFVTYALNNGTSNDSTGTVGQGFVDEFNLDGSFVTRLISGGQLDQAWGLALAPSTFGQFANALLVGNFGNGWINAYDPTTGAYLGYIADTNGHAIAEDGLWGLQFGNGGSGGLANTLYFTAGLNDENDGLFGQIQSVPEPTPFILAGLCAAGLLLRRARV